MKKVCFVCLGNICRSTMAEFVMKSLDDNAVIHVESRGTSNWEHGNPIHSGTKKILKNIILTIASIKPRNKSTKMIYISLTILLEWILIMSQIC